MSELFRTWSAPNCVVVCSTSSSSSLMSSFLDFVSGWCHWPWWVNLFTCSGTRRTAYSASSLWSSSTSSSSSWISTFLWWPAVSLFHSSGKRFMLRFRLFQKISTDPMFWCVECLFQLETFSRTWNFHFPLEKNTEPESGPKIQFTISF